MSDYTTSVMDIVKSFSNTGNIFNDIKSAAPKIFDFEYPIWDMKHKNELQEKIVRRYINREIGLETYGLWKLYLCDRMNSIMPYFNDLAKSLNLNYDILSNVNLVTDSTDIDEKTENTNENYTNKDNFESNEGIKDEHSYLINNKRNLTNNYTINEIKEHRGSDSEENSGSVDNTGTQSNEGNQLTSDLPQYNAAGYDYGTENRFLKNTMTNNLHENNSNNLTKSYNSNEENTGHNVNTDDETININDNGSNDRTSTKKDERNNEGSRGVTFKTDNVLSKNQIVKGNNGKTYGELIQSYRESLINIDNMIIDELSDLFMNIY